MAKQQTDKSRYPSRYGGSDNYVTGAQYIIELVAEKKARFDKRELPMKFWVHKDWAAFYRRWLRQVHALLKKYDEKAIIRALQSKKCGMRWSLHTEYMLGLIEEEQVKLDKEVRPEPQEKHGADKPVVNRQKDTKINKLMELD